MEQIKQEWRITTNGNKQTDTDFGKIATKGAEKYIRDKCLAIYTKVEEAISNNMLIDNTNLLILKSLM